MKPYVWIAFVLPLLGNIASAEPQDGPAPVRTFAGERKGERTLAVLPDGTIVYAPDARSTVDRDGRTYSLRVHNQYQQSWNPLTKSVISVCSGSDFSASVDGKHLFTRSLSGCVGQPVFTVRNGRFFALLSGKGLFNNGSLFLLPNGEIRLAEGVPGAAAVAVSETTYYAANTGGWGDTLEVYALSLELGIEKVHRLGMNASSVHIVVDDGGKPHVTYYDTARRVLMYGRLEGGAFRLYELDAPDTGFEHSLDVDGRDVIIAAYFIRNPYNKGISLYRIPVDGADVEASLRRRIFLRRKDENVGWSPVVSTNGAGVALSVYNRTKDLTEVYLVPKDSIDSQHDHRPEWLLPWMAEPKKLDLYVSLGLAYAQWSTKVSTDFSGATISSGRYRIDPFFLQHVGVGGEINGTAFAFDYMVNALDDKTEGPPAAEQAYEFFSGMIAIDDLIGHDKILEAHTRTGKLQGRYDSGGSITNFTTKYYDVDVDVFNKRGYFFWGFGYRTFSTPQPVVVTQNNIVLQQYVTNADFRTYSVLLGVSTLNYLRRYETAYNGFYVDARGYFGIGDVTLDQRPAVPVRQTRPIVVRAAVDAGYMIFRRSPGLAGLAWFASLGVMADYTYMNNEEFNQDDAPATEGTVNLDRQDLLSGVFLKVGLAF